MALKPLTPGLRRFRNDSKQVAKVDLHVRPGDELEVSEDVAAQLEAASTAFKPADGLPPFPDLTAAPAPADEPIPEKPASEKPKRNRKSAG